MADSHQQELMMMQQPIPLEDDWNDVVRKARRGLHLSEAELAAQSGVPLAAITTLEKGTLDPDLLEQIAAVLKLDYRKLNFLAQGKYHPGPLELPPGLMRFTSPWNDFVVHSYLLWDESSSQAAAFDTGSDATEMMEFLSQRGLSLTQIFLTHGHGDHVFELDRLLEKTKAQAWIGMREEVPGARNFSAGSGFSLGSLTIETRSTWGHSAGGISYVIHGFDRPVVIVGDALFVGSMGGAMQGSDGARNSYAACLETNRRELLSLPPETLLCPGHGPLTTVALELAHNPFF